MAASSGADIGRRAPLARWYLAAALNGVPQAAAPILFALLALPLTGNPRSGAALVLATTLAQIVGAVPVTRFGRRFASTAYLRALVVVRTAFLGAMAVAAGTSAPFWLLIATAAGAGLIGGAAFGYQRAILNRLVPPERLPRAVALAATLNEITFVSAPVIAGDRRRSPLLALAVVIALGLAHAVAVPTVPDHVSPSVVGELAS